MICTLFSHAASARPMMRNAYWRAATLCGIKDFVGAAMLSAYSRMSVESIKTVPSSHIDDGALTTGLRSWNCSNVRNTDRERCSNGNPRNCNDTATRRTYGESSIPMSCMILSWCPAAALILTIDETGAEEFHRQRRDQDRLHPAGRKC